MGSSWWISAVSLMQQTASQTPQSHVDNYCSANGVSFHLPVCCMWIFLFRRNRIFSILRQKRLLCWRSNSEKVFPFSLLKTTHSSYFRMLMLSCHRGPVPLWGDTLVMCDTEAVLSYWSTKAGMGLCRCNVLPETAKCVRMYFLPSQQSSVERRQGFRGLGFIARSQCLLFLIVLQRHLCRSPPCCAAGSHSLPGQGLWNPSTHPPSLPLPPFLSCGTAVCTGVPLA